MAKEVKDAISKIFAEILEEFLNNDEITYITLDYNLLIEDPSVLQL
jgi:hypothetical protein